MKAIYKGGYNWGIGDLITGEHCWEGVKPLKIDETNFMAEIKNKNPDALEFAVNSYGNLVYKIVYGVLGRTFEMPSIEECVSDAFFAAWNHIESYNEEKGNFKNWLLAIARYKAIDYRRKFSQHGHVQCLDDSTVPSLLSVEEIIIAKENKEELIRAIQGMGDTDKQIFIRRYFLGESILSIAQGLGTDRTYVDNRLSRGRKALREKLVFLKGEVMV